MIVFIEGPRHVGKTHLIDYFFKNNQNPNVIYYKFAFAKYIEDLEMKDQEAGPGVHYFSVANIMTILELNKTILKDKILVFDRSIFSAYVWSIYRDRMDRARLLSEFEKILASDLYQDCTLLYLTRNNEISPEKREKKDYFGNFENYDSEKVIFEEVLSKMNSYYDEVDRNNKYFTFTNNFDQESTIRFYELMTTLSSITLDNNK